VAFARGRAMTIDEGVAFAMEHQAPSRPTPAVKVAPDTGLTRRQLDIARLVADNLTNRQIAARLFLSERTVETHVTNILNKLGLNSRTQISRWLAEQTEAGLPRQANPRSAAARSSADRERNDQRHAERDDHRCPCLALSGTALA
jgi:DNA-binding CsgD family transcriptional regulator